MADAFETVFRFSLKKFIILSLELIPSKVLLHRFHMYYKYTCFFNTHYDVLSTTNFPFLFRISFLLSLIHSRNMQNFKPTKIFKPRNSIKSVELCRKIVGRMNLMIYSLVMPSIFIASRTVTTRWHIATAM